MASPIEIDEVDEAGNLTATYLVSTTATPIELGSKAGSCRVDVVHPTNPKSLWQKLLDVFLPAGYPQSVTEDYIWYQTYDSLQAFASSIAGMLSSRAVLEGVGVGDASASPTAALLLSVFQESAGRIATILFAHKFGTALEPECKRWRLAADVFNDAAMILDLLSPVFPRPIRVGVLAGSSVLRSLCGVAAGSAKASLSAHFAKQGNLGEVNAKDSSQETVISLMGMLAGTVVVHVVMGKIATWVTLLVLLAVHLAMNTAAVRAVSMRSLNRQRANIVFSRLLAFDKVLLPQQVSALEWIFERDGVLRWTDGALIGHCNIGVGLDALARLLGESNVQSGSTNLREVSLTELLKVFQDEGYLMWYEAPSRTVWIALKHGCSTRSQLQAWCHALLLASDVTELNGAPSSQELLDMVKNSLKRTANSFDGYGRRLESAGWDLDVAALETHSGPRAVVKTSKELPVGPK